MNMEQIMSRLQNGESLDTIAQEMEDMLNSAAAAVQKQKAEDERESRLNELADTIANAINEYMRLAAPGVNSNITAKDMRATLDESLALQDFFMQIVDTLKHEEEKPADSPEAVFANFFKSLNI